MSVKTLGKVGLGKLKRRSRKSTVFYVSQKIPLMIRHKNKVQVIVIKISEVPVNLTVATGPFESFSKMLQFLRNLIN